MTAALLCPTPAQAGGCRTLEVRFAPQGQPPTGGREELSPQIAVWLEDAAGNYIDTLYVTKATGLLGIGNRPGRAELKSDFRWPYGKRPMVLPVWAHRRGKTYPLLVMGGRCSPNCGGDAHNGAANPDDENTVAYHANVSSTEPYFCSPSGWRTKNVNGVDVVSCASAFYGSKGRFLDGATSVYPPRADLTGVGALDSPVVATFAALNDLAAVSAATPKNGAVVNPPLRWPVPRSLPDGDYVVRVEVNLENDFNPPWWDVGRSVPDGYPAWDTNYGRQYVGQPSIVYAVPLRVDSGERTGSTVDYQGYGDVTGKTGTLNPPDMTIRTSGGSGADRLKIVTEGGQSFRVQASVRACTDGGGDGGAACVAPPAPLSVEIADKTDTSLTAQVRLSGDPQATLVARVDVRYRPGMPIDEASFSQAVPAASPPLTGASLRSEVQGLLPRTTYYVAARTVSSCGAASVVVGNSSTTERGSYAVLHGCFVATAAYGTPMEQRVQALRKVRDRYLLTNPAGQALTATYYALSPPLAELIAGHQGLRQLARRALDPVVNLAQIVTD